MHEKITKLLIVPFALYVKATIKSGFLIFKKLQSNTFCAHFVFKIKYISIKKE